jgi:hypothetical protein
VHPLSVVVALHVSEEVAPGLIARGPAALMDELNLQGMEKALRRGVDAPIEVKRSNIRL